MLDTRINTPNGFEALQAIVKADVSRLFSRGSVQVSLRIELDEQVASTRVNEEALNALIAAHKRAMAGAVPSGEVIATLMTARGVIVESQGSLRDLASDAELMDQLASGARGALAQLNESRLSEGASLSVLLSELVANMRSITNDAEQAAGSQPHKLRERLIKQLNELGADQSVDPERLAAEVALSAAKADVREELDRLAAHYDTANTLLANGSPAGRKLDFLAQELNREANTLCSKSTVLELTNAGLALKALIDQFKEQAANVE